MLSTLPDATFADGMAEVVKYGYIANKDILDMVSQPDYKAHIEGIIYECVKIKRDVVAIDEHDTGLRMILNFGHTIGHAAEKLGNYTDLTHGQAVAIGMVAAMRLSALLGNDDLTTPLVSLLQHIGLPTELTYDRAAIFNALLSDKKKFGATVNFILVREPGRAEITPIEAEQLHEYILKPVSYTHLDVYKRQAADRKHGRQHGLQRAGKHADLRERIPAERQNAREILQQNRRTAKYARHIDDCVCFAARGGRKTAGRCRDDDHDRHPYKAANRSLHCAVRVR